MHRDLKSCIQNRQDGQKEALEVIVHSGNTEK